MADVFLSYASEDRARAAPLARALQEAGFSVWWDRDIRAGADFSEVIERELTAAGVVVVAWSSAAAASKWVRDEAAVARDAGKLAPVLLDASLPPLGFRQLQAIDFSDWNGDAAAPAFQTLLAALRGHAPPGAAAAGPASILSTGLAPPAPRRFPARILAGIAGACVVAAAGAFVLMRRDGAPAQTAAAPSEIAVLEKSARREERAAHASFVAGDRKHALALLERLASDLEAKGETAAAAAAYSRAASVALLVDQARGLAARRKAFAFAPQSFAAFQGLFFDTLLVRSPAEAQKFANDVIIENANPRMRAFANAHLALLSAEFAEDFDKAEGFIARAKIPGDPGFDGISDWAGAVVNIRRDWLADARVQLERSRGSAPALAVALDIPVPFDVVETRLNFLEGDWRRAFETGSAALVKRRGAGQFIPTPILLITCESGLHIGDAPNAAPFCEAIAAYQPALSKLTLAQLAAERGDLDEARAEIAASRAISGDEGIVEAQRLRIEARIAARAGDLDAAEALIRRHVELVAAKADARSWRATAQRLLGMWMIRGGAPARACAPLAEAAALYAEIGGKAGAAASQELADEAGCGEAASP